MSAALDATAYAALAVAVTAAGQQGSFTTGAASNTAMIAAVAQATMAMSAAQQAANATILTAPLAAPADVLNLVGLAQSLAQNTAGVAELTNTLTVVDPNQTALAVPVANAGVLATSGPNPLAFGYGAFGVAAFGS